MRPSASTQPLPVAKVSMASRRSSQSSPTRPSASVRSTSGSIHACSPSKAPMPLTAPDTSSGPTSRPTRWNAVQSSGSSRSTPSGDTTTIMRRDRRVRRVDVTEAGQVFVTPSAFADDARFHEACALLRKEDPVHLVQSDGYRDFYVLTKHADVHEVELHAAQFSNGPQPVLTNLEAERLAAENGGAQMLRTL